MHKIELKREEHFYIEHNAGSYAPKLYLNREITIWIMLNIASEYHIFSEKYLYDRGASPAVIIFEEDHDAMAFKLRWL